MRPGYDQRERDREFTERWRRAERRGRIMRAGLLALTIVTAAAMAGIVWFVVTTPPEAIGRYIGRLVAGARDGVDSMITASASR